MNYILVRAPVSGNLYVLSMVDAAHYHFFQNERSEWEVLAEGPDKNLLQSMLELSWEPV